MIKKLLLFLLIFLLSFRVITDSDFGWHIRVGEYIAKTRSIPKTDLFSFSQPDYPYVYHSWAAELFMYLAYKLGGLAGSTVLFAALTTASIYLLYQTMRKLTPNYSPTFLLLATLITSSIAGGRTRAFGFFFITLLEFIFIKFISRDSKIIWLTPLVLLVWVNFHGSFILGILILLILSALAFHKSSKQAKIMLMVSVLSTLATLINPYSTRAWEQALRMSISSFTLRSINTDWISLISEKTTGWIFAGFVAAFILLVFIKKLPVARIYKYLVIIFFLLSAASSRFAIALVAFFIPFASQTLEQFKKSLPRPAINSLPVKFSTFCVLVALILSAALNLLEAKYAYSSFENYSSFITQKAPPKVKFAAWPYSANHYLNQNFPGLKVLNDANWGGFMLLMSPHAKLFYYGAMDNFFADNRSFVFDYLEITYAGPSYQEKLEKYQIEAVFLPEVYPLIAALKQDSSWQVAYEDKGAVIIIKK